MLIRVFFVVAGDDNHTDNASREMLGDGASAKGII